MDARILIIEDNPLNMELASELLEAAGWAVLQAGSAEAGLTLVRAERPDLVLCDIRLPGMDGYQAVRALRADPSLRHIPAVALSAQTMKGDAEAALAAGFDGFIGKPIDTRAFAKSVASFLRPTPAA